MSERASQRERGGKSEKTGTDGAEERRRERGRATKEERERESVRTRDTDDKLDGRTGLGCRGFMMHPSILPQCFETTEHEEMHAGKGCRSMYIHFQVHAYVCMHACMCYTYVCILFIVSHVHIDAQLRRIGRFAGVAKHGEWQQEEELACEERQKQEHDGTLSPSGYSY